jgi:hypothetical protein
MRHWTFWEWVAYACILVGAVIIAADTGIRLSPDLSGYLPSFADGPVWGFAPATFVIIATCILLYREFFGQKRSEVNQLGTAAASVDKERIPIKSSTNEQAVDPNIYNELVAFSLDILIPSCEARIKLNEAIVAVGCKMQPVFYLAIDGLRESLRAKEFYTLLFELEGGLCSTEGAVLPYNELVRCIHDLEAQQYQEYCAYGDKLAVEMQVLTMNQTSDVYGQWESWRDQHNAMISAYEKIKRDARIPRLFRPGRESRWGGQVA